jgi:hypothetical protein
MKQMGGQQESEVIEVKRESEKVVSSRESCLAYLGLWHVVLTASELDPTVWRRNGNGWVRVRRGWAPIDLVHESDMAKGTLVKR